MILPKKHDITLLQGSQFPLGFHWYGGGLVCAQIEAITPGCPTLITITSHGMPSISKTPIRIRNVKGLTVLNTGDQDCDRIEATYVDPDTFSVPIDTTGSRSWQPNTGSIDWFLPKNLIGWTARMQIRENIDDEAPLVDLTSGSGDITISLPDALITVIIATTVTEGLDFLEGVYDLELVDPAGEVTRLLEGTVELRKEVTR